MKYSFDKNYWSSDEVKAEITEYAGELTQQLEYFEKVVSEIRTISNQSAKMQCDLGNKHFNGSITQSGDSYVYGTAKKLRTTPELDEGMYLCERFHIQNGLTKLEMLFTEEKRSTKESETLGIINVSYNATTKELESFSCKDRYDIMREKEDFMKENEDFTI